MDPAIPNREQTYMLRTPAEHLADVMASRLEMNLLPIPSSI